MLYFILVLAVITGAAAVFSFQKCHHFLNRRQPTGAEVSTKGNGQSESQNTHWQWPIKKVIFLFLRCILLVKMGISFGAVEIAMH